MAEFNCPDGQICGKKFGARVGEKNTNLFFQTATTINQSPGSADVTGGETTLYVLKPVEVSTGSGNTRTEEQWVPAAKSKDGRSWENLQSNGQNVLGADAINSLQSPDGNLKKNTRAVVSQALDKAGIKNAEVKDKIIEENKAPEGESADQQSGDQSGGYSASDVNNFKLPEIGDGKYRKEYRQDLRYPLYLSDEQDKIRISMYRYKAKPFNASNISTGSPFGQREKDKSSMGTVLLPISSVINDSNAVEWSQNSMTSMQAAAAAASQSMIMEGGQGVGESLDAFGKLITGPGNESIKRAIATELAGQAAGVQGLLSRTTGAIQNPNMELLFTGPQLRSFNYTFRLTPRSAKEAREVRQIIRFFKQGMSVKKANTGLFLKAPNIFSITYLNGNKKHPYLNTIKDCALVTCSVNYTPDGNYMAYSDEYGESSMTSYELQLTFNELEPLFDDDYTELDQDKDLEIGY